MLLSRVPCVPLVVTVPALRRDDVTREIDNKRIAWAAGDLTENRPALSRWHPDYKAAFETFMAGGQ